MKKILVANRGEIALRVMRSAREMGIRTVAVYSEADRDAMHVKYADEAYLLGPAPAAESYLQMDKIIALCKEKNVDGIHPGYGFLSENEAFARKVAKAGITFIGPSPQAIKVMGSKLAAKAAVAKYNIPMVPGTDTAITDVNEAKTIAKSIGYPILIKASAGGGGKGMRVVEKAADLKEQMERAISEAEASFGDGSVFIEKYVGSPRHVEVQVLGDSHGNIVHLFERECSVQRRHQKVIEEAPSAVLTPELRDQMGKSAVDVARACKYQSAGTVEFLLDDSGPEPKYYFLEMNTRLQVEHPVTEMITNVDLVKEQINIARGKKISFKQEDLEIHGHAVELRVYAEDPENDFLPDIGTLATYRPPQGPGVRVDDGYREGMEVPIHYDPMIAKLSVHGKDRKEALARMVRAIDEYHISGVKTTLAFGRFAMEHKAFRSGKFDTHFVGTYYKPGEGPKPKKSELNRVAAIVAGKVASKEAGTSSAPTNKSSHKWRARSEW